MENEWWMVTGYYLCFTLVKDSWHCKIANQLYLERLVHNLRKHPNAEPLFNEALHFMGGKNSTNLKNSIGSVTSQACSQSSSMPNRDMIPEHHKGGVIPEHRDISSCFSRWNPKQSQTNKQENLIKV